jgi:hypothetical protein
LLEARRAEAASVSLEPLLEVDLDSRLRSDGASIEADVTTTRGEHHTRLAAVPTDRRS